MITMRCSGQNMNFPRFPLYVGYFIDRQPMGPHDLIQAFSRTNRIYDKKRQWVDLYKKWAILDVVDEGLIERDPTRKAIIQEDVLIVHCIGPEVRSLCAF